MLELVFLAIAVAVTMGLTHEVTTHAGRIALTATLALLFAGLASQSHMGLVDGFPFAVLVVTLVAGCVSSWFRSASKGA